MLQNWRRCCDICITTGAGCPLCMRAPRRQCVQRYNLHGKASLSLSLAVHRVQQCLHPNVHPLKQKISFTDTRRWDWERNESSVCKKIYTGRLATPGAVRHFVRLCRQNIGLHALLLNIVLYIYFFSYPQPVISSHDTCFALTMDWI